MSFLTYVIGYLLIGLFFTVLVWRIHVYQAIKLLDNLKLKICETADDPEATIDLFDIYEARLFGDLIGKLNKKIDTKSSGRSFDAYGCDFDETKNSYMVIRLKAKYYKDLTWLDDLKLELTDPIASFGDILFAVVTWLPSAIWLTIVFLCTSLVPAVTFIAKFLIHCIFGKPRASNSKSAKDDGYCHDSCYF